MIKQYVMITGLNISLIKVVGCFYCEVKVYLSQICIYKMKRESESSLRCAIKYLSILCLFTDI